MTRPILTIRRRLALSGALVLALFGVNLAVGMWSASARDAALAELHRTLDRRTRLTTLARDIDARAREAAVTRHLRLNAAEADTLDARVRSLFGVVGSLQAAAPPADTARTAALARQCDALVAGWLAEIDASRDGPSPPPRPSPDPALVSNTLDLVRAMSAQEEGRIEAATDGLRDLDRMSAQLGVAFHLISMLVASWAAWWLWARVASAFRTLIDGTRRVGRGELAHRIPLAHHDELGEVAQAFNDMSASLGVSMDAAHEARAEAERANRAKSTFLASMTHELRTPMTSILGYLELARDEARGAGLGQVVDDLTEIERASTHMLTLINELLDLAKAESGKMSLHVELFDLAVVVDDVVRAVGPIVREQGNRLAVDVTPGLGSMTNDATKLRQTLFNLLGNAAKFTRDGEITVTVRPGAEPDTVVFAVHDTGIGIPADRLARIFDEFEQGDGSVARAYGGTGLGLTLAQRFCRLMGGDIAVESEEGRGTTFTVELPREYQGSREAALTVVTTGEAGAGEAGAGEEAAAS